MSHNPGSPAPDPVNPPQKKTWLRNGRAKPQQMLIIPILAAQPKAEKPSRRADGGLASETKSRFTSRYTK
jgi:hypothetical protein